MRVLQVVGGLNRGGAEAWLQAALPAAVQNGSKWDFLVHGGEIGEYEADVRRLGSDVIHILDNRWTPGYRRELGHVLKMRKYDAVHSHVSFFSRYILNVAEGCHIPIRIAHAHGTDDARGNSMVRRAYRLLMRTLMNHYATKRIACARVAGQFLFGDDWGCRNGDRILYCGIDLTQFRPLRESTELRRDLGLPKTCRVLAHVGRFFAPKNHRFVVRIAAEILESDPNTHLLLLGDGPLRKEIEDLSEMFTFRDQVHFCGNRGDVPTILRNVADVMIFPSLNEGLPLALLEAQAASVPSVVASTISTEVVVIPGLIRFIDLDAPLTSWTEAIRDAFGQPPRDRSLALRAFEQSAFDIRHSVGSLMDLYGHGRR